MIAMEEMRDPVLDRAGEEIDQDDVCEILRMALRHEREVSSLYSRIARELSDEPCRTALREIAKEKRMHAGRLSMMISGIEFMDEEPPIEGWETHRFY
jgi:rubrerythrin